MALGVSIGNTSLSSPFLESKKERKAGEIIKENKNSRRHWARLMITERIWSRTVERFFRRVESKLSGVLRISEAKTMLRNWIKSNVPLNEEN